GNHNGWKNNILNLPDYIDLEFARFFGFMIGDGWINQDFNRVSFARGINETTNSKYDSILAKYSGKNVIVLPPGENSGGQSYVDSKLLAEFLYVNGFRGTVTTKRIPHWVYEMSDEFQREFIQGLVDADGSIFTDKWNVNRYSIELNNKELVEDIKSLLGRLNIKCSNVKTRGFEGETEICGIKCNRNKSYYIYFYLDGEEKSQLKKYDFVHSNNIFLYPVTKIENIGEQETFDIQVDSSNSNFISNGIIVHNSMIEGARRVWKQLSLMEDAMLISRIMRAPERRIFYTDIANIPPNEVDAYMQKMMDKLKKVPYIDEKTGEYNLRFNLQNMIEDYYIPVRGGDSGTRIDTLSGMEWTGIDDLEYIKTKMMSALKIPKAFLGFEEGISGKATLASEDVRFARTIQRLQRIIASELSKIAIIHLYAQGYRDESLVDFEIELTNPSTIFEKEKIEIWQDKVSVSIDMIDNKIFPYKWIYRNIFNMSEDDIKQVQEEIVEDAKQRFRFTRIEEDGDDPAKPYKKIKLGGDEEEEGGGGGGESDLGDLLGGGGGLDKPLPDLGDLGKEGGGGGGGGGEAGKAPDLSAIKEITEKKRMELHKERKRDRKRDRRDRYPSGRDQTGEKKSPNISEDPLGALATDETHKEKSEGKSSSAIGHNYAGGSPLSLKERKTRTVDDGMITSLSNFLKKSQSETKKELLEENRLTGSKSLLDESQILE
ncbi:MAG TPA: portal protein, partial [Bacteroidales bacterium]|nr:portal protein [Bacteroidales bacterium]